MKNSKSLELQRLLDKARSEYIENAQKNKETFGSRMILSVADTNIEQMSLNICENLNINTKRVRNLNEYNAMTRALLEEALIA
ncbi:TPA: hypothetical protein NG682_005094 [Vibrio parahaemolyticus]|nr:hypothetical protein [Vibrio parahaemolyticus]HCE3706271.1 hypothetical protein [Vibrio parahaemolyticus]